MTDTVHIIMPLGADADATVAMMQTYGEIACATPQPGFVLRVAYFDVRAAAFVLDNLGGETCWPGVAYGNRTVRLPGSMNIGMDVMPKISGMYKEKNSFVIEFFDLRDAQCYRLKAAESEKQAAAPNPKKVQIVPPPGLDGPSPAKASSGSEKQSAGDVVAIKGIPNAMLTDAMMEAILEQAGLEAATVSFTTRQGSVCGDATIKLSSNSAAQQCIRHFHGCQWAASGVVITAQLSSPAKKSSSKAHRQGLEFADMPGLSKDEIAVIRMEAREDKERGNDKANAETFGTDSAKSWTYREQLAANNKLRLSVGKHARSEASTDISESEGEVVA